MVYLRLLRVPRLRGLLAATVVGRLNIGINALAVVLFLREERGAFGIAGIVAGALALGTGLGAPFNGRLVDRLGRRMIVPIACVHAAGLVALVVLGSTESVPGAVLVVAALLAGAGMPPISSVLRSLYPTLLRDEPDLRQAAFAFDSVLTELLFVLGPLVVSLIVLLVAPAAALLLSATTVVAGTVAFYLLLPQDVRDHRGSRGGRSVLGALASPGIQTLVMTMLPFGMAFGMLEVILPAFARAEGHPGGAGLLIAIWSVASAAGGFVYGMRALRRPLPDIHLALALCWPLAGLPLLLASSMPVMALLVIPAGLPIAPLLATRNELAGASAPKGAETEAYTWVLMSMLAGVALGAGLAGVVVDEAGWWTATVVAIGVSVAGALAAIARRTSLQASLGSSEAASASA